MILMTVFAAALAAAAVWAVATERRAADVRRTLAERETLLARAQAQLTVAQQERARLEAALDAERHTAADKVALLENAQARLKDAFAALSADVLAQNTHRF